MVIGKEGEIVKYREIKEMGECETKTTFELVVKLPKVFLNKMQEYCIEELDIVEVDFEQGEVSMSVSMVHASGL